jgi:sodium-dependent dicarboxylate transporter 2/3/5
VTIGEMPNEERDRLHWPMLLIAIGLAVATWVLTGSLVGEREPGGPSLSPQGRAALAVTVLTAACWLLRAMPLAAASFLPLALFPTFGVTTMKQASTAYADPILWMFFGGFVLALAIERCGLHRRVALRVVGWIGAAPRRLVLGMLAASTLLSMWINNTATTLALLPIGWALVERVSHAGALSDRDARRFGIAMMLGIAYGASVGGVATPIGTAPNLLFFSVWRPFVDAGAPPFAFLDWLLAFVPFAVGFSFLIWIVLTRILFRLPATAGEGSARLLDDVANLPPMSSAEKRVAALFALAVIAWVTREDVSFGDGHVIAGWASRVGAPEIKDGTVAIGIAILAFLIPGGGRGSPPLMDWATARRIPFEILFLLGGGVAIADALGGTGASAVFGAALAPVLDDVPAWLAVGIVVAFLTFLTEVASNTAITALMLPLLLETARQAGLDPRLLLLPATIAASCGFMMPIGTPPNAIVYATGKVTMREMAWAGIWLNLASIVTLTAVMWFWALPLLGIDPNVRPTWLK